MTAEIPASPKVAQAEAFGAGLVALTPRLRQFVRRLCLREADDLVQEALARALRSRDSFRPDAGSLEAWLMKIAFRTYLDHRARRRPDALGDADVGVRDLRGDLPEVRDALAHVLEALAPIERDVLLRFHRDRRSVAEIARDLAMPEGTVKSHLHRARARLAQRGEP